MTYAFTIIMIPAALSVMEMLNVMGEIIYKTSDPIHIYIYNMSGAIQFDYIRFAFRC